MRSFSPTTAGYFAQRGSFVGHVLIWLTARNRSTGADETIGFWTGSDHREFTISGDPRTYYAAGAMLQVDPIRRQTGIRTRTQRVTFSQIAPEVLQALRGYDPRHAPVEMHRALFDPETDALIDEPHVILRGFVAKAPITTPAKGEAGSVQVEIATHAQALTRILGRSRSDASMRTRAPDDAFRQYASIADAVDTPWGKKSESGTKKADESVLGSKIKGPT